MTEKAIDNATRTVRNAKVDFEEKANELLSLIYDNDDTGNDEDILSICDELDQLNSELTTTIREALRN